MSNCYTAGEGATHHAGCECHEAAHRAEVERLRDALEQIAKYETDQGDHGSVYTALSLPA